MANAQQELNEVDQKLKQKHGAYASYATDFDPVVEETYGEGPSDEMERLLDRYAKPDRAVLDLGCGAGFTLCRLAPHAREIWGFEQEQDLLSASRLRVSAQGLKNVKLVQGNVAEPADVAQLPDGLFDLGFSQRGPNLVPWLLPKLKDDAIWVQEFARFHLGINEILGRSANTFLPHSTGSTDWAVGIYAKLALQADEGAGWPARYEDFD